jgi:hypothetical protein
LVVPQAGEDSLKQVERRGEIAPLDGCQAVSAEDILALSGRSPVFSQPHRKKKFDILSKKAIAASLLDKKAVSGILFTR